MGTILAVILATLVAQIAVGGVLLAAFRLKKPAEAKPTRKGRAEMYVTHEELVEAIADSSKQLEFEWNEWYEKFDKLHLRLAKRAKRAEKAPEEEQEALGFDDGERPSVLQFRRIGSV